MYWHAGLNSLLSTLSSMAACLATFNIQPSGQLSAPPAVVIADAPASKTQGLQALNGEWFYLEDRTENQPLERMGPPMASKFSMRVEEGKVGDRGGSGEVVILNGHGSGHKDVRIAIDGSITEVTEQNGRVVRYQGSWKDGTFQYEVKFDGDRAAAGFTLIRRSFQMTPDGLIVRVSTDSPGSTEQVGLYRLPQDIPMPTPAKATIADVEWIAGAWVGKRSSGSSIEERWSPPLGGAMLATSRTVNTSGKMVAFEYLRIVERDGGLVYSAQPGGAPKTDFVLSEFGPTESGGKRAVFDNPRHDYPKRIVYELSSDGNLSATIGYMKGGTPRRYEWKREGK